MSKLRVVYIVSLLILGVLLFFTVLKPLVKGSEYSEVARMALIQGNNEYIVEFDIINREGETKKYYINALIDGEIDSRNCTIQDGSTSHYIYHLYPEKINDKRVTFTIYKEGEDTPFEELTYYISLDEQ